MISEVEVSSGPAVMVLDHASEAGGIVSGTSTPSFLGVAGRDNVRHDKVRTSMGEVAGAG
jgi:hypothetical protein